MALFTYEKMIQFCDLACLCLIIVSVASVIESKQASNEIVNRPCRTTTVSNINKNNLEIVDDNQLLQVNVSDPMVHKIATGVVFDVMKERQNCLASRLKPTNGKQSKMNDGEKPKCPGLVTIMGHRLETAATLLHQSVQRRKRLEKCMELINNISICQQKSWPEIVSKGSIIDSRNVVLRVGGSQKSASNNDPLQHHSTTPLEHPAVRKVVTSLIIDALQQHEQCASLKSIGKFLSKNSGSTAVNSKSCASLITILSRRIAVLLNQLQLDIQKRKRLEKCLEVFNSMSICTQKGSFFVWARIVAKDIMDGKADG